jgi:uncharacterized membrane protein YfcA
MLAAVPIIAVFLFANKNLGEDDHIDEMSGASIGFRSAAIGLLLGGYQGFYGPGGGLFFMLAYTAFLKLNLVRATGNTRFVIAAALTISVSTYASSGAVLWSLAIAATAFNIAGSWLGAALAIKKGAGIIRPLMICVVLLLIAKLIFDIS